MGHIAIAKTKGPPKRGVSKWPQLHQTVYQKCGAAWSTACTEPPESIKRIYPGLYGVKDRELDKAYLNDVGYPEQTLRAIEVSQSAGRTNVCDSIGGKLILGTIYPNARYYVTTRCRLLLGEEEMRLMSLWFGKTIMEGASNNLFKSFAGNAFETS